MVLTRIPLVLVVSIACFTSSVGETRPVLENKFVHITVDPLHGGAIASMIYKKAETFPFIRARGAGVAGTGTFFSNFLVVGTETIDLGGLSMKVQEASTGEREKTLRMTSIAPFGSSKLHFERVIHLAENESGLRIKDTFRPEAPRQLRFQLGVMSREGSDAWRLASRSWFGDSTHTFLKGAPTDAGQETSLKDAVGPVFWRMIGQYGSGFFYQVNPPAAPVTVRHHISKETGNPVTFQWQTGEIVVPVGQPVSIDSTVLIDEGGRQSNPRFHLPQFDRVLLTADLRAGSLIREPLLGFVTIVSATPIRAKAVVFERHGEQDRSEAQRKKVVEQDFVLQPGQAQFGHFTIIPQTKGLISVEAEAHGQKGERLAFSMAQAVVQGEGMDGEAGETWATYSRKMPEETYAGTWREIGRQSARDQLSDKASPLRPASEWKIGEYSPAESARRLAFFERRFPYYAEMLKGAAEVLQTDPGRLSEARTDGVSDRFACMDVFFNGPDGPINAFSKERTASTSLRNLDYNKVLPNEGYAFHTYMGVGINQKGLSISSATLNCDARTVSQGEKATAEWKASGHYIARMSHWMLLATCQSVEEAIAFFEDPEAPVSATANYLLVDRFGHAARIESSGILHQVFRYRPEQEGFLVAGNYSHAREDGLFQIGEKWGWAANTMLREKFLWKKAGYKKNRISLQDVFWLMETHAPGGMCQHICDNPGRLYSSCSFIAVSATTDLWLSHGPPCQVRYVRYTLGSAGKK